MLVFVPVLVWLSLTLLAGAIVWQARSGGFRIDAPASLRPALFATGLGAALGIAAVFRLARLETVPPGLYLDEVLTARNAVLSRTANAPLWGSTSLRDAGWVETSNLYLRAMSAVMRAFGDGFLAARMMSILPSLACVVLAGLLGAKLFGRAAGVGSALLLAISHWAARTGRTGWDEVTMTALQLAALALLAHALETGRARFGALAGVCLGLSLYTYVASRLVVASAGAFLLWELWRGERRRTLRIAAACLGTAGLVYAPHLAFLLRERTGALGARTGQLLMPGLATGEGLRAIGVNALYHLGMFNVRGGAYARDAYPLAPMLDPVTGVLFLAGVLALLTVRDWRRRLLASWFVVCVLGGVLSSSREGPPYVYRVANLAPWACVVAAAGASAALSRLPRPKRAAAAGAIVLAAAIANGWLLFAGTARCPDFGPAFGTVETQIGLWLLRHPEARPCLVDPAAFDGLDRHRPTLWLPDVNGDRWYRTDESIAAVQLAAGLWAKTPDRAKDPPVPRGDVDLLERPPAQLPPHAALVVPREAVRAASARYPVAASETLVDSLGRELCTVLVVGGGR